LCFNIVAVYKHRSTFNCLNVFNDDLKEPQKRKGKYPYFCFSVYFCHHMYVSNILCCQIGVLIREPGNAEAKQFFPLLEEKLLMSKFANHNDEEKSDESRNSNTKSISYSNSSNKEEESCYSEENLLGNSIVFLKTIL
uniref:Uncharacterized protein n=1 Tax=Anser brachyrhynchus TaxID=132585 RepID=A0A8B9D1D0_9AVES